MTRRKPAGIALLAVLLLVSSGCVGEGTTFFAGPTGVPLDAPTEVGDGDFEVQVRVGQDSGEGEPLAGAPVVIHHIPNPVFAPSVQELLHKNATLGGRTGPDGILRARLDKGETYTFLTAVSGWTAEARHLVKITEEYRHRPLHIALFNASKTLEYEGKVPLTLRPDTPTINLGFSNVRWWPTEVRFHEDEASNRQYLFRLHKLETTLTVSHPPASHSNIHLRLGLFSDNTAPIYWDMRSTVIGASTQPQTVKRLALYPWDLANFAAVKNPVLKVGPMTMESAYTIDCIPWQIMIEAGFDTKPRTTARKPYTLGYGDDIEIPQPPPRC